MGRLLFALAMMAMVFGFYRCAHSARESSRYQPLLTQALEHDIDTGNPLCQDLYPVERFPYLARVTYDYQGHERPPQEPLQAKWEDLVAAGLLRVSPQTGLDLKTEGYVYELTEKGRDLYQPRQLPAGGERARFCLGRPVVKSLEIVSVPGYNIQGLQVVARYVLAVPKPSPLLFDDTAAALNLHAPHRNAQGAVEYPPAVAVFTLERGTDKVVSVEER